MADGLAQMPHYETTLDRAGIALAMGGALGGLVTTLLVAAGGVATPTGLVLGFLIGAVISAMTIVAVAGPIWILFHAIGWRGAASAGFTGALAGFGLFLGGQTYGFGLFSSPITDDRTLLFRWLSGMGTSAIMAVIAAVIGIVMWRVAYRRY